MLRRAAHRPSSNTNIVFDGNSLVFGQGALVSNMPTRVMATAPFVGSGAAMANVGISGQSWRMMNGLDTGSVSDVDGAWVSGKFNILVAWEATNSIAYYGRTVSECVQDCVDYIAARKAVHPWRVVLLTTIPRNNALDSSLRAWDALAKANYRAWGADVLIDVRRELLNFSGENDASFSSTQPLWSEGAAPWVHLTDAGYQMVANWVAEGLRRVPGRAPT